MPFAEARDRLMVLGISGDKAEAFWLAVRGNLDTLADAANWWRILGEGPQEPPEFSDDDRAFLEQAFELLPEEPVERDGLEGLDRQGQASDGPQGQGAVHAAQAGPYWTAFRAGACRSIAAPGSGRNVGPTTLTLFAGPAAEPDTGDVTGLADRRLMASRSSPPSILARVSDRRPDRAWRPAPE